MARQTIAQAMERIDNLESNVDKILEAVTATPKPEAKVSKTKSKAKTKGKTKVEPIQLPPEDAFNRAVIESKKPINPELKPQLLAMMVDLSRYDAATRKAIVEFTGRHSPQCTHTHYGRMMCTLHRSQIDLHAST